MEKEIQWTNGKDEYTRQEIEDMLSTQRAMMHNDVIFLINSHCKSDEGHVRDLTKKEYEIMDTLKNPRKVIF